MSFSFLSSETFLDLDGFSDNFSFKFLFDDDGDFLFLEQGIEIIPGKAIPGKKSGKTKSSVLSLLKRQKKSMKILRKDCNHDYDHSMIIGEINEKWMKKE